MCILAYFRMFRPPVLYVQTCFNTEGLFCGIFMLMRRIKVTITLREDLVFDFRGRGLSNLSAVIEELLSAFLSSIPSGSTKRTAKETLELVRNFLSGRSTQAVSSNPQELFQQFMAFLQSQSLSYTPGQPQQTLQPPTPPSPQPQPQPQPQYQPSTQPKPTAQEQKPKPKISTREILRAVREHAIEYGVPPELVDYERILEEARREAEEEK
jgi:pyruvate/2-oxoglutarate dehydrogenase complex dihydrolipoamide acyltransferase (E2) component